VELKQLKVGDRVQMHPATNAWMRGDRFGEVVAINTRRGTVRVLLWKSERKIVFRPINILEVL
jgi:hypothetical protein